MELIEKKLKERNYEAIFVSVATIIFGLIMILFSKSILNIISYLMGGILIINGILKIFYYLKYEGKNNIFNYDLSFGIINIILGIICIIFKEELQSIFRIVIGLMVIYEGVLNITLASKIFYVDKLAGILSLVLSFLVMIGGGLIILTKGILISTIGYVLIALAIMNIGELIIFKRNLKKIEKYFKEIN